MGSRKSALHALRHVNVFVSQTSSNSKVCDRIRGLIIGVSRQRTPSLTAKAALCREMDVAGSTTIEKAGAWCAVLSL